METVYPILFNNLVQFIILTQQMAKTTVVCSARVYFQKRVLPREPLKPEKREKLLSFLMPVRS